MVQIRPAVAQDVPGIAGIIQNVWQVEIDQDYCRRLIDEEKQVVQVVALGDAIAGFVSSFITTGQGGVRRWEVDLIAVSNDQQNTKLGQKLLAANWEQAQQHHVKFARAVIRLDNVASQKAFEAAGYTTNGNIYNMYLWEPVDLGAPLHSRGMVNVETVETLTYRGLWLEGLEAPLLTDDQRAEYIAGGRTQAYREGRANCSTLLPAMASLPDGILNQAKLHGQFQWWRRP